MTAAHPATLAYESAVERASVACAAVEEAELHVARAHAALRLAERRLGRAIDTVRSKRRRIEKLGIGPWEETYDSTPHIRPEHGRVWLERNAPGLLESEDEDETTD